MFSLLTLQILSPFHISPPKIFLFHLPSPSSLTHTLLLPCPGIPLCWAIKPSQDQGPLLSLMSHKVILCYICGWSLESLLVCSLVPGSSGGTSWFILLFLLWGCKPLQVLGSFLWLFHWGPCPMDGCEPPLLFLSDTGRASHETAISGSYQQAHVGIHNSVWVW